jgi:hypothetical protein
MQRRQLPIIEDKELLDKSKTPISYRVATKVNILQLRIDNSLKEFLCTFSCEFIVL